MTKSEAIQQCKNDDASLPVPRSDEENEFFYNLQVHNYVVNNYGGWIGINDEAEEDNWVTDNGEELIWFSWAPDEQPGGSKNGGTRENAAIIENNGGFGWHDVDATRKEGTTCVKLDSSKHFDLLLRPIKHF